MRKSHSTLLFSIPLLLGAILVGCNQSATTDSSETANTQDDQATATNENSLKTLNQFCPIMGGKVASTGGTVKWNGKLIGFCCPECEPKWEKLTDDQKTEKLAEAGHKAEGNTAHTDHNRS